MNNHLLRTTVACLSAALLFAACGPTVNYTPDDPSDVRNPRNVEDVKFLEDGETPGPGYRTLGSVEVTAEVTCNTAMMQSKESAKSIIDEYVKNHMDLAESTSQEVVEAMVENGDLSKSQACKVLPIFAQIPEKEEILVAVLKGSNLDLLVEGTADAGGEGLYEVEHEIYKTRKKPALSGAGAVSPALVINVKSIGKVITLKDEEPEEDDEEEPVKKVAKKPKKKTEEVVVVKKSEPQPDDEEDDEETTATSAKKSETVLVKKADTEKKVKDDAKVHKDEPWPPPDDEEEESDEELDPKAAAKKAKIEAEEAMKAVKVAKKKAKEAKLAAEAAEKEKKKAAMLKKKADAKAEAEAELQAKKDAKLAKKKAAEEAAAKKKEDAKAKKKAKAEEEAKKKEEAQAKKKADAEEKKKADTDSEKKKVEVEGTELGKADKETINEAKNIIRGWKKEIFVCLHKSDIVETAGKVALMFFIDIDGQLDALSITPQPEPKVHDCVMKTVGDLDYPEVGVTYEFSMKYKIKPD